jgi:hypothetical protein
VTPLGKEISSSCTCPTIQVLARCSTKSNWCPLIRDLCLPPAFHLALHGLEVSLDPVHAHGKSINQVETLAVLGQDRSEHAWDNVSKFA